MQKLRTFQRIPMLKLRYKYKNSHNSCARSSIIVIYFVVLTSIDAIFLRFLFVFAEMLVILLNLRSISCLYSTFGVIFYIIFQFFQSKKRFFSLFSLKLLTILCIIQFFLCYSHKNNSILDIFLHFLTFFTLFDISLLIFASNFYPKSVPTDKSASQEEGGVQW